MKKLSLALLLAAGLALPEAHAQIRDSLLYVAGPWMTTAPVETTPAFSGPTRAFIRFNRDGTYVLSLGVEDGGAEAKNPTDWLTRLGFPKGESVMTHPFFMAGSYTVGGDGSAAQLRLNAGKVWTAPGVKGFNIGMPPLKLSVTADGVSPKSFRVQGLLTDDGTLVLFSGRDRLTFRGAK